MTSSNNGENTNHNNPLLTALIGLMCAGILVAAGTFTYFQFQESRDNEPTSNFSIQGSAEEELEANQATLRFSLESQGAELEVLNEGVDTKVVAIKEYLEGLEIANEDIQINKNSYEDYYRENPTDETIWRLSANIEAEIKNLQEINTNEVFNKLAELGVGNIQPLEFKIDNREERCEELLTKAITDARDKADQRLQALGGDKIVKTSFEEISSCNNEYGVYPIYPDAAFEDSSISSEAPDVLQGNEKLRSIVNLVVEYR